MQYLTFTAISELFSASNYRTLQNSLSRLGTVPASDVKPNVQGFYEDGMSYIHLWRTQQEFLSDSQMEMTKNRIRDIKILFYTKTLAAAIPEAQQIITAKQ